MGETAGNPSPPASEERQGQTTPAPRDARPAEPPALSSDLEPARPRARRSFSQVVAPFVSVALFFLCWAVLLLGLPNVSPGSLVHANRIFIILIAGLLPAIIYSYYIQGRLPILRAEYKQNLRRLGFFENATLYQEKFDAIYGAEARPRGEQTAVQTNLPDPPAQPSHAFLDRRAALFQSPVMVATLLSFLGWMLVFYPTQFDSVNLAPNPDLLVFGFLGAYIFSIGALVRQYVTDDIQPRYYAGVSIRYLTVIVLSWLIPLVPFVQTPGGELSAAYQIAMFFIGAFPATGLRVIQRAVTALLGLAISGFEVKQPLSQLDGLNAYQEDRLLLEGIENLQNLSTANIVDLMLKTRYPVEQIVDWIDQALLHVHAREQIGRFQRCGLRTATDFLDAYTPPDAAGEELAQRRKSLSELLAGADRTGSEPAPQPTAVWLELLVASLRTDPNLYHIRYWRDHAYEVLPEDVERQRTIADLRLLQGEPDDALRSYDALLLRFPEYHTARLYRGLAYYHLNEVHQAIDDLNEAIARGGRSWDSARYAYLTLGFVQRELKELDQAVETYTKALRLFPDFPEALFELALVHIARADYDAAIDRLDKILDGRPRGESRAEPQTPYREAESRANRGLARLERWRQRGRQADQRDGELGQARDDLELALRRKPTLIAAYLNLANVLEELGLPDVTLETLDDAVARLDRATALEAYRVRLARGARLFALGRYEDAAADYRAATQLLPNDAAAYFNLGAALRVQGALAAAQQAFTEAVRLNPLHAPANQQLGEVLVALDDLPAAERAFGAALRLARAGEDRLSQAQAHLGLGLLYRRAQRVADARRELQRALRLGEDLVYVQASYELGLLDLEAGALDSAITQLAACVELFDVLERERDSIAAGLQLGQALTRARRPDEARQVVERAREQLAEIFDLQRPGDVELQQAIDAELERIAASRDGRLQLKPEIPPAGNSSN